MMRYVSPSFNKSRAWLVPIASALLEHAADRGICTAYVSNLRISKYLSMPRRCKCEHVNFDEAVPKDHVPVAIEASPAAHVLYGTGKYGMLVEQAS